MTSRLRQTAAQTVWHLPLPVLGALFLAATANAPGRWEVRGVGLSAASTVAMAIACGVEVLRRRATLTDLPSALEPFTLFIVWGLVLGTVRGSNVPAAQNLTTFGLFVLLAAVGARLDDRQGLAVVQLMLGIGWAIAVVYGASLLVDGAGTNVVLSARSFAIQALPIIAVAVPRPSGWARPLPWVLTALVGASLSRSALVVAVVLLCIRAAHTAGRRRPWRAAATAVLVVGVLTVAVAASDTLHRRVFHPPRGEPAVEVLGVEFNGEGRADLWSLLTDRMTFPHLVGFGPGTSTLEIDRNDDRLTEPHNDYLRVLYDYGSIGLLLFLWGLLAIGVPAGRRALRQGGLEEAAPHTTAVLALVVLCLMMTTDNVLVYGWSVAPIGLLVGLSLRPGRVAATS